MSPSIGLQAIGKHLAGMSVPQQRAPAGRQQQLKHPGQTGGHAALKGKLQPRLRGGAMFFDQCSAH